MSSKAETRLLTPIHGLDAFLFAVFLVLVARKLFPKSAVSSPPGPTGYPLIGSSQDIPADRQWVQFDKWIRAYGT